MLFVPAEPPEWVPAVPGSRPPAAVPPLGSPPNDAPPEARPPAWLPPGDEPARAPLLPSPASSSPQLEATTRKVLDAKIAAILPRKRMFMEVMARANAAAVPVAFLTFLIGRRAQAGERRLLAKRSRGASWRSPTQIGLGLVWIHVSTRWA
jgi:hypothetical protein